MRLSLIVGILCVSAGVAAADAQCSYVEIAATKGKDPKVDAVPGPLAKKLQKPPFTAWNVLKVVSSGDKKLSPNKPEHLALKSGSATIMLRGQSDTNLKLEVTIDDASGKRQIETKQDSPKKDWSVFVYNEKDDGHLLAVSCE